MLIAEVVEAMRSAQESGYKVLAFVVPITEQGLHESGLSAATIEDRVQTALIAELRACLVPSEHIMSGDIPEGQPVWLTEDDIALITNDLQRRQPDHDRLITSREKRRAELIRRLAEVPHG